MITLSYKFFKVRPILAKSSNIILIIIHIMKYYNRENWPTLLFKMTFMKLYYIIKRKQTTNSTSYIYMTVRTVTDNRTVKIYFNCQI